ncbi:MAG: HipA N-terminal domain-containing protein [Deltaproteobacteria bacterium]|nr:HipA N-terminal domain-containing protein [Deltaproteobacteria bacterium]
MRRTIKVFLDSRPGPIGMIHYNADGARESAVFEYDPSWLRASDRFAIEPNLPLVRGPQYHRRAKNGSIFHAAIADTEPDGWGRRVVLRDEAKQRQQARLDGRDFDSTPFGSLDMLLAVDDASRIGALRFQDEEGVFRRAPEKGKRSVPPLVELRQLLASSRAVELQAETVADLAYLRGRGTSLGGLRPKCTVIASREPCVGAPSCRSKPLDGDRTGRWTPRRRCGHHEDRSVDAPTPPRCCRA